MAPFVPACGSTHITTLTIVRLYFDVGVAAPNPGV
jgi:hypothetical protein